MNWIKQLKEYVKRGFSIQEMSERLDLTEDDVNNQLGELQLLEDQRVEFENTELIKCHMGEGKNVLEITEVTGLKYPYVYAKVTTLRNIKRSTAPTVAFTVIEPSEPFKLVTGRFTKEEDDLIIKAREEGKTYTEIAVALNRKKAGVNSRHWEILHPGQRKERMDGKKEFEPRLRVKIPWTSQEDSTLAALVSKGLSWSEIPEYFTDRSGNACRKRYQRLEHSGLENVPKLNSFLDPSIDAINTGSKLENFQKVQTTKSSSVPKLSGSFNMPNVKTEGELEDIYSEPIWDTELEAINSDFKPLSPIDKFTKENDIHSKIAHADEEEVDEIFQGESEKIEGFIESNKRSDDKNSSNWKANQSKTHKIFEETDEFLKNYKVPKEPKLKSFIGQYDPDQEFKEQLEKSADKQQITEIIEQNPDIKYLVDELIKTGRKFILVL